VVGALVTAATTGAAVGAPVVTETATGAPVVAAATGAAVGADLQLCTKNHKVYWRVSARRSHMIAKRNPCVQ
jgi:hypothetical protein